MTRYELFTGVVITSNSGSGAITVINEAYAGFAGADANMMQGTMIAGTMSSFLGFKEVLLPQPGSRVLCIKSSSKNCYIVGMVPQENMAFDALPARCMLGAGSALGDKANRKGHLDNTSSIQDNRNPADVVDGEYVVSNEFGVLLGLYQQMAHLKASELAQVQCHLLDDLVRVISHNFQHYTAIGEYNIYHDGKALMAEFGATHKPGESYGRPAVNDKGEKPVFAKDSPPKKPDDETDFYKFEEDERIKAIERFKIFLGSVGDFLHLFLVRPDPDEARILDPDKTPKKPDTGLCDIHIGTDGGMHLRSVKEIFIEKTNWIRVPLRKAAPDDPKGDDASKLSYEHKDKFTFNDQYKYLGNPFTYALQIRDYVAYVNEKLNYQNFKKHEKDFYVNDEISKETKLSSIGPVDSETDLNLQQYQLRTAGIYLMPNGGITIRDAWNSAIVMEGGSIYLQPAKDLVSQPLRSNIVKAGAHINMACKGQVDISSTEGGLRLKSEKAQYFYSHNSGVIIEANGSKDTPGSPDPEQEAVEDIGGIVLKSKLSIYNYAEKNVVSYAKQQILLQSLLNLDMVANTELTVYGKQNMQLFSDSSIILYADDSITQVSDGTVAIAGAVTTALGQKDQNLGVMYDKDSIFIDILKGVIPVSDVTSQLVDFKKYREELLKQTTFQKEDNFDKLKFKFLKSDKYKVDPEKDSLPTTLAQQDDLLTSNYSLKEWTETEVNESLPYPGKDLFTNFYYKAEKPVNLEKNSLGKDYSSKAKSEKDPAKIQLGTLQGYKIL